MTIDNTINYLLSLAESYERVDGDTAINKENAHGIALSLKRAVGEIKKMKTGPCRYCKWWGDVSASSGRGICDLTVAHFEGPEFPESKAIANSHEVHPTYLETQADFGCVQFHPKEAS